MKKRLTLVILLDDDIPDIRDLADKPNEVWAEEMRQIYGQEPGMELLSVTVEDAE